MKRFSLILVVLFLPAAAFGWFSTTLDTVEVRYPSGQLKEQYQTLICPDIGGPFNYGFYRSFHNNGQIEWEGEYGGELLSNIKVGTWIKWDSLGFRLEETSYDRGLKNGPDIKWNPDGTFRMLVYYEDDTLHGLCTWSKPGTIFNGVFNNPDLVVDSQLYYLNGRILLTLKRSDWPAGVHPMQGPPMPNYNFELDLWYETRNLYGLYSYVNNDVAIFMGRKVDGKKDGMWIQRNKSGDMIRVEYYDKGTLLSSE